MATQPAFSQQERPAVDTSPLPTTTTPKPKSIGAAKEISFGAIAGALGKLVEYPFDTVKVRLQSQPDHLPLRYTGPIDCFRQSLQQGGLRSLYRGVWTPFVGAGAETACLFYAYDLAQGALQATLFPGEQYDAKEKLPLRALVAAGAMSGGLTSLVLTPIELVKCRTQAPLQSSVDPTLGPRAVGLTSASLGTWAVVKDVYRREGLRGFWRGQFGTLLRETGGSAAWFGSQETVSRAFKSRLKDPQSDALPYWQRLVSGAVAGVMYNFIFFPADTIKSKIQTGELNAKPTFANVGRELFRAHGLKGLYRGCGITVARSAPSSALIFTIYEELKTRFG